ncbi:hypothetical protein RJ640_028897 [Escallonia rubra]|uniref:Peptidase A1 domain-containing protein n=1 Tax=Escallonia rubra TaxID=112253 RepID=A0AA88U9H2_9ASTE|nr:hypothetical protein RJ640_028897 [Escallonia rubra]
MVSPIQGSMASRFHLLIFFSLFSYISHSKANTSFRPRALVLPVTKDPLTQQYTTHINKRTPFVPVKLTVDLGGQFLWVDCDKSYVSSSYKPVHCDTSECKLSRSQACTVTCFRSGPRPGCNNNTCSLMPDNPIISTSTSGDLGQDVVSVQSTDGSRPGPSISVPDLLFSCAPTSLLQGLARGVRGMAGLGRVPIALPLQFTRAFGFAAKFAVCLSSTTGAVFFGDGPYVMQPGIDAAKFLTYTPLIKNRVSTAGAYFKGDPSVEYFIGVKSIKINNEPVALNASLLSIFKGNGGTKISTVNPYTVLETSIYKAVTNAFVKHVKDIPRVAPVAPFGTCFNAKNIGSTRVGPAVPQIDLVLQSESEYWRIFGVNSMVNAGNDVLCLGFVDGGLNPRTSIVIGGHQIEDNLLQFDLAASRLGFSSSLLFKQTNCGNFNFKPNA